MSKSPNELCGGSALVLTFAASQAQVAIESLKDLSRQWIGCRKGDDRAEQEAKKKLGEAPVAQRRKQ